MMECKALTVQSNQPLNPAVWELKLAGDGLTAQSGQFIELEIEGCTLKRPFSVADCQDGVMTVLYKVIGEGTRRMTDLREGDKVNALTNLGRGFDIASAAKPLLIGGGIGAAPLYLLAKEFVKKGIEPVVLLAFRCAEEVYYLDEFDALGSVLVSTDNGSLGYQGNALEALKEYSPLFDTYYACGPLPMLRALAGWSDKGQLSLEARMGCGFGACMGCSIMTTKGPQRVCKEGPVFAAGEVMFS